MRIPGGLPPTNYGRLQGVWMGGMIIVVVVLCVCVSLSADLIIGNIKSVPPRRDPLCPRSDDDEKRPGVVCFTHVSTTATTPTHESSMEYDKVSTSQKASKELTLARRSGIPRHPRGIVAGMPLVALSDSLVHSLANYHHNYYGSLPRGSTTH